MNCSKRPRILNGYPEGTVSAWEFAVRHGIAVGLLRRHIVDGIDGERIEAMELRFGADGKQVRRYLTPEQQSKALAFWDKHKVPYIKR